MANRFDIEKLAAGHVLPPVPFPYVPAGPVAGYDTDSDFTGAEVIEAGDGETLRYTLFGTPQYFPLEMRVAGINGGNWWLLPVEPLITLGGGNVLVRRSVAKAALRGTVKGRWATDDYSISIEGLLTRQDEWRYPTSDVQLLRAMLESRQPIDVKCPLLEAFGIGRMVVEKYDWPFTKGEENQAYRISAYSDDDWNLFIEPFKK